MFVVARRRLSGITPMLLVALAALTAKAGLPEVLDRVPAETPVVIAVGNLESTMKRADAMAKSLGKMGEELAAPLWHINSMLSMPGVNKAGSMAIAVSMPEKKEHAKKKDKDGDAMEDGDENATSGGDEPPGVAIVPVSDYTLFVKTFKGDGAAAMTQVEIDGHPTWIRNLGEGYAAMGSQKDLVEKFDGKAGRTKEHVARMGKVGASIAESTDILLLANMSKLEPMVKDAEKKMKQNPAMGMLAMQGGGQAIEAMQSGMEKFARDAQTGIIGLGLSEKGMTLDFGAQFKDGSDMAKFFAASGNSHALVAKLPAGDFLFAGAMDVSSAPVKQLIKDMGAKNANGADADPAGMLANLSRSIDSLDGQAVFVGSTELGSGFMSKTVVFAKSGNPQALMTASKENAAKLNGMEVNGIKFETSYQAGAKEVNGVKVDKWTNKMETDPNSPMAMQVEMMKSFVFGSEGKLSGYVAPAEGGVITTMSENSELLKSALEAAKGGKNITSDPSFASAQSLLIGNRVVEGYIGTKSLMETIGGLMSMYGGPEMQAPDKVSPIAMGLVSDSGGMAFRLAMPTDVIQMIANTAGKMKDGMDDAAEPDEKQPAKKKDTGRRF